MLILDEPTRGLDPERKAELGAWLEEYAASREGRRRRHARPRAAGAPANRTLCFRNTSGSSGGDALPSRVAAARGRRRARARRLGCARPEPRRDRDAAGRASPCSSPGFAWLEGGTVSARDLTLVATLGGLAAAGRVLFAPIPSVQPVTVIVAAAGVALGPRRGFAVGALAAIASNFFLGQGPHTPWQMLAWGGCGLLAGLARPLLRRRLAFAAFVLALGFAFGMLMDVWLWFAFYPHTEAALLARLAAGVPFNVAHAAGNVMLALVAGPELRRVLERYERRSRTEVVLGVKLLAAVRRGRARSRRRPATSRASSARTAASATRSSPRGRRSASSQPVRTPRGAAELPREAGAGVGDRPRARGDGPRRGRATARRPAAAPARVPAGEARQRDDLDDPGAAAGGRACAGRARHVAPRARSGRTAAGRGSPAAPPTRTTRPPRSRRSAPPGVTGRPIDRGVAFLRRHQNADGGFELTLGRGSDTQSTAWAIQALLAAGRAPGTPAFRYLARMRRPDGSYRYNARYVTTPLWVTAQVLPALARRPFPLTQRGMTAVLRRASGVALASNGCPSPRPSSTSRT